VDPQLQDLLNTGVDPLALANPMSSEQSVMRTNLLPGLVGALRSNINRQQVSVRLFELGLCFLPGEKLDQPLLLGGLLWGRRAMESLHDPGDSVDFFDLKGEVERLLEWCGYKSITYAAADDPVLHPGQRAAIHAEGVEIGRLGRLHPEIEQRLELSAEAFVFEIAGDAVLTRPLRTFSEISKFPSVRRDFAFVLRESVSARQVEESLRRAFGDALTEFRLFDLYRGKGIDSNEKSVAVGLTFQHPSATLTESEISQFVEKAVTALERDLNARLR
jgi:phenylalanyl-tRNA synthetase beta chain